jgi:hypothetical protein
MKNHSMSLLLRLLICVWFVIGSLMSSVAEVQDNDTITTPGISVRDGVLKFEENKGQLKDQFGKSRPDVKFYGHTQGMNFYLRNTGMSYQLSTVVGWKKQETDRLQPIPGDVDEMVPSEVHTHRVDLHWLGANQNFTVEEGGCSQHYNNYYNVPEGEEPALYVRQYESIWLKNVYEKIDLHCYSTDGNLETDWLVSPGGDHRQIRMEIRGAELDVDKEGCLVMKTPLGEIREGALKVYQGNERINASWIVSELPDGAVGGIVSFDIPNFNSDQPLRIDPLIDVFRRWATYYGGSSLDYTHATAVDPDGNVIIAGITQSTASIASGGHQNTYGAGSYDAFLVKFDTDGARQWATYYGGTADDYGNGCATDTSGNVYLGGSTRSSSGVASGGFQNTYSGDDYDGLLVKFDENGIRQWGTYYGSTAYTSGTSCTTDSYGHVYLTGTTWSTSGIAYQGHDNVFSGSNGASDVYLVQFNEDGSRNWGTYYGGTAGDHDPECTTDGNGSVYVLGSTMSTTAIAYNGYRNSYTGGEDLFLVKFDSLGTRQWATYYGSSGVEYTGKCATDSANNVYITGMVEEVSSNLAWQGFQNQHAGSYDALLVKFNQNGTRQWATYYGTWALESAEALSVDGQGQVYLAGRTESLSGLGIGSDQLVSGGMRDTYLAKFNGSGVRQWSTYFGGDSWDMVSSCAADVTGNVFLSGRTGSTTGVATNGHQNTYGGGSYDAFLVKFFGSCVPVTNNYTLSESQVPCHGDETASITFELIGGTAPFEYSVDGGNNYQLMNEFDGLGAGTYDLYLRDFNGCTTPGESVSITEPTAVTFSTSSTNNICPNDVDGSITVVASGGSGNYEYSMDGAVSFQTQSTVGGLQSGVRSVVVRDDLGCMSTTQQVTITSPTEFDVNYTVTPPLCFGQTSGVLQILANGGTGPLSYSLNAAAFQPSATFGDLEAGSYYLLLRDVAGCDFLDTIIVGQPSQIVLSTVVDMVECREGSNGFILVNPSGGSPGYHYSWMPQVSTSESADQLTAGDYVITVTDSNNCNQAITVTVTEPEPIHLSVCLVTVDSTSSHNTVVWEKPLSAEIDSFYVYREVTQETYYRVGALPYAEEGRFEDIGANPNVTSYRYRISALDTCGVESPYSLAHRTIHLQSLGGGNLLWNHYEIEGEPSPVDYYRIYRDDDGTGDFQLISNTVPGGNNSYTDIDFGSFPNASYLVDVSWSLSCDPSRTVSTTRSNRFVVQHPDGFPSSDRPVFQVYPNPASMSLIINLPDHFKEFPMSIFNTVGQEVLKGTVIGGMNSVDLSGFAQGFYTVTVGSFSTKLVVN